MSSRLDLRVAKLERGPVARGLDLRVFSTIAEAEADADPPASAMTVLRIVTGVSRTSDTSTP